MKTAAAADVRTLPWVEPPPQSERQFDSAPSNLFSRGWSDRVPEADDKLSLVVATGSHQMVQDLYDLHGILDHC